MRELSVYYCPRCGRYGYYLLTKNTVCINCSCKMKLLGMPYPDFINLSLEERDQLLTEEILSKDPSISNRILADARAHNTRAVISGLQTRIHELEAENQKLNETVEWMHQTIWDLLSKTRSLQHQLEESQTCPDSQAAVTKEP